MSNQPRYFSQFGEDKWIAENLPLPDWGAFIEVGAYDGIASSNTLFFERRGWAGFCIEPELKLAFECSQNRRAATFCCAVGLEEGISYLWQHPTDPGQSSLLTPEEPRKFQPVIVQRLERFAKRIATGKIWLLSIDTEGTEMEVWQSIGGERPEVVIMEYLTWGRPPRDAEIKKLMEWEGYTEAHRTEANLIFVLRK